MFKQYKKIHRLGSTENEGILIGTVHIQEKIDGANTSIWSHEGRIRCGSRTRELEAGFNGFVDYVNSHQGIQQLLSDMPHIRLYGEWLLRHSISYNETAYKEFYLFDVMIDEAYLSLDEVYKLANKYGIKTAEMFAVLVNPTEEDINQFVGKTVLGAKGEGVVVKNLDFVNQFGDRVHAKVVTQDFKELNALTFGGNNKHSDTYWEMYIVNKYLTLARVQKIMHKIEPLLDHPLSKQDTSRIAGTVYHDLITEEAWEIANKVSTLDFKKLKQLVNRKSIKMFHDILDNTLSVAYTYEVNNDEGVASERKDDVCPF